MEQAAAPNRLRGAVAEAGSLGTRLVAGGTGGPDLIKARLAAGSREVRAVLPLATGSSGACAALAAAARSRCA